VGCRYDAAVKITPEPQGERNANAFFSFCRNFPPLKGTRIVGASGLGIILPGVLVRIAVSIICSVFPDCPGIFYFIKEKQYSLSSIGGIHV